MTLEQLEPIVAQLRGQHCVVLGSAPLEAPVPFDATRERLVVVNGAVSSLEATPDVWVLNSRSAAFDSWGAAQRRLTRLMVEQGTDRWVRTALLLTREPEAFDVTRKQLAKQRTDVDRFVALTQQERRAMESASGLRSVITDRDAMSAGMTAAALCVFAGCATLRLEGFSWAAGYHYLPGERIPTKRGHEHGDKRALGYLVATLGTRLTHSLTTTASSGHATGKASRVRERIMAKKHSRITPPDVERAQRQERARLRREALAAAVAPAVGYQDPEPVKTPARPRPAGPVRVMALKMGWYGLQRRRPKDVFVLRDPLHFSQRWMRRVDEETPLHTQTIQDARRAEHREILEARAPAARGPVMQPNAADVVSPSPLDE